MLYLITWRVEVKVEFNVMTTLQDRLRICEISQISRHLHA